LHIKNQLSILAGLKAFPATQINCMNLKKLTLGALAGGILYFLLGWLVYGILLKDLFHTYSGKVGHIIDRPEAEMDWLFLVGGNLAAGILLSWVIQRSASTTLMKGLVTGAVLGFLVSVSVDCVIYATSYVMSKHGILLDVMAATVIGGIVGAVLGLMNKST